MSALASASTSPSPPPPPLPPVEPPASPPSPLAIAEEDFFLKGLRQSYYIRMWAGYGGLVVCALLYLAGLAAAAVFMGLCPRIPAVSTDKWHIVVAIILPLFTVPTVLLLAVLRTVSVKPKSDDEVGSFHEALGQMVSKLFDKASDLVK